MVNAPKWSEVELQIMRDHWYDMGRGIVSLLPGRTENAALVRAKLLRLKTRINNLKNSGKKCYWRSLSPHDKYLISQLLGELTHKELADKFEVPPSTIATLSRRKRAGEIFGPTEPNS